MKFTTVSYIKQVIGLVGLCSIGLLVRIGLYFIENDSCYRRP